MIIHQNYIDNIYSLRFFFKKVQFIKSKLLTVIEKTDF